jgi:hypothetical protein
MRIPMIRFRHGKRPFGTPLESLLKNSTVTEAPKQIPVVQSTSTRPQVKPSKFVWSMQRKPISMEEIASIEVIYSIF